MSLENIDTAVNVDMDVTPLAAAVLDSGQFEVLNCKTVIEGIGRITRLDIQSTERNYSGLRKEIKKAIPGIDIGGPIQTKSGQVYTIFQSHLEDGGYNTTNINIRLSHF